MQESNDIEYQIQCKKKLLFVLGEIIHNKRLELNKGINKFSYEYDIGNGLLSGLEKGKLDSKISTLWKISNAFDIKCSDLIKLVEEQLGDNFNFYY